MRNIYLPSLELVLPKEVEIHYKRPLIDSMAYIDRAERADFYIRRFINLERVDYKEFFWVMLLNRGNRVLAFAEIGSGTTEGVCVNTKEIFQLALLTNASSIILVHNHPSGKLETSERDRYITEKIKEGTKLFDIQLLDHIIITSESYLSFAEEGEL